MWFFFIIEPHVSLFWWVMVSMVTDQDVLQDAQLGYVFSDGRYNEDQPSFFLGHNP